MKRCKQNLVFVGLMLALLVSSGCNQSADSDGTSEMDDLARMLDQPKQETPPPDKPEPTPPVATAPVESTQSTEFNARSGRRGQSFHGQGGYLNAVFSARFTAENQMTKNVILNNMKLFRATNDRYPNSHEEFMQKIIVEGGVTLPELRPGEEYWYDPETAELMVRTPVAQ